MIISAIQKATNQAYNSAYPHQNIPFYKTANSAKKVQDSAKKSVLSKLPAKTPNLYNAKGEYAAPNNAGAVLNKKF